MVTQYTYDSYGRNNSITYPSGITLTNVFDANNRGYLYQIKNGADTLWQMHSSNNRGQPLRYYLGSQFKDLQVNFSYDGYGKVSEITTGKMKQSFSFDAESGNLMLRAYRNVDSVSGLSEAFEYDNLNRLLSATVEDRDPLEITYLSNGNINSKSDAGSHYYYNPDKTNAVDSVINSPATPGNMPQNIEYNSYNLTTGISGGSAGYAITYNPLNQRIRTVYSPSGSPVIIRYYSGGYEKTDSNVVVKETHYVYSPFGLVALIVKMGETVQTYFVETDHLGSIIGLINPDKTYAERASFDPWGRRRNPTDWSYNNVPVPEITDRGFTEHEHLDQFGLINMNGRMYDPVIGRFLGVDPVVQSADFSQSFNGYSYCLNNPLIYIDPSGYVKCKYDTRGETFFGRLWANFVLWLRTSGGDGPNEDFENHAADLWYDYSDADFSWFVGVGISVGGGGGYGPGDPPNGNGSSKVSNQDRPKYLTGCMACHSPQGIYYPYLAGYREAFWMNVFAVAGFTFQGLSYFGIIARTGGQIIKNGPFIINQTNQAILRNGYYEVNGLKFSEYYYNKLWTTGRGAPSLVAREILEAGAKTAMPDPFKPGFFNYTFGGWEMTYNPTTFEVWHLQPILK